MIARISIILFYLLPSICSGQNVFQSEELFGLEMNGKTIYNADYDEIIVNDYFIYGRKDKLHYILSENIENSKKAYKKFLFHLTDDLLVVGITADNKLDLLSEDGSHFYMQDGNYDKAHSSKDYCDEENSDVLLVTKDGKFGFYNWVKKTELVPAQYDRLQMHEGCPSTGKIIYSGKGHNNAVWSEKNGMLFSFKSAAVDDIYQSTICEGYILKFGNKIGYIREKKNGKFFLVKPIYEDLYFPTGDPNTVMVESYGRYGLYHNNRMILKCKYSSIEVIDGNYIFAIAIKYRKMLDIDKVIKINREGKLISI